MAKDADPKPTTVWSDELFARLGGSLDQAASAISGGAGSTGRGETIWWRDQEPPDEEERSLVEQLVKDHPASTRYEALRLVRHS